MKVLELLPDGLHLTTELVANYFEVRTDTVENLLRRHRPELEVNGLHIISGADLREYQTVNLTVSSSKESQSYLQRRNSLALYTRRTVLNVAMLLRDSAVARRVRTYLLDVEEGARHGASSPSLERRMTNVESALGDIGPALRDLGAVIHRMSVRLERVERRVENTDRVVGAMSERVAGMASDLGRLRP